MADTASLAGVVGTWIAVLFALVALAGIVTPWLLLRAAQSERSRALNAAFDINEEYISRGIGLGRNFRLFHRVTVPNLAPVSDWSDLVTFTIIKARESWALDLVRQTKCRTGWARVCKLLDAYGVKKSGKGRLEIRDQHTWLPISRYWILTLGLLGRYGYRKDGGIVYNSNRLRRDLRGPRIIPGSDGNASGTDSDIDNSSSTNSSLKSTFTEDHSPLLVRVVPGGDRLRKLRTIEGITGSFRKLWPSSESTPYGSSASVIFTLHNNQEMGIDPTSVDPKKRSCPKDFVDLRVLYWLATGFLPKLESDCNVVICLQDPIIDVNGEGDTYSDDTTSSEISDRGSALRTPMASSVVSSTFTDAYEGERWRTFELLEAQDRPNSMLKEMMALDITSTKILSFQDITSFTYRNKNEREFLRQCSNRGIDVYQPESRWVRFVDKGGIVGFLKRSDLQQIILQMLVLPWHPWSYLIWTKTNPFWNSLMCGERNMWKHESIKFLLSTLQNGTNFSEVRHAIRKIMPWACTRRRAPAFSTFNQRQTVDLMYLEKALQNIFQHDIHILHIISVIFISVKDFRSHIERLFSAAPQARRKSYVNIDTEQRQLHMILYEKQAGPRVVLKSGETVEKGGSSVRRSNNVSAAVGSKSPDPEKPAQPAIQRNTSTAKVLSDGNANSNKQFPFHQSKVSVMNLANTVSSGKMSWSRKRQRIQDRKQKRKRKSNSLKRTSIEYTYDDCIHPKTSGENVLASVPGGEGAAATYTHESGSGTYFAETAIQTPADATLEGEHKELEMTAVSSDQLLIACYWAATRCALWSSSPDSKPLIYFVQGLTDIVHIA